MCSYHSALTVTALCPHQIWEMLWHWTQFMLWSDFSLETWIFSVILANCPSRWSMYCHLDLCGDHLSQNPNSSDIWHKCGFKLDDLPNLHPSTSFLSFLMFDLWKMNPADDSKVSVMTEGASAEPSLRFQLLRAPSPNCRAIQCALGNMCAGGRQQ